MDRRFLLFTPLLLAAAPCASAEEKPATSTTDPSPTNNDIDKYPRCVICNMDRCKFHFARHLLYYGDGHAEGTCSIHCAAECMLKERRRGFQAIYAPDYGAEVDPKPLIEAASATYLIGSDLRGVMTAVSKYAFAHPDAAKKAQAVAGGTIGTFADAVQATYGEFATGMVKRYNTDRERMLRKMADGAG